MPETDLDSIIPPPVGTVHDQLERAVRDLWAMIEDSGEDFVTFMDRRRMSTRVALGANGLYCVSWEQDDGSWVTLEREFENPREAAFHGYQGPH